MPYIRLAITREVFYANKLILNETNVALKSIDLFTLCDYFTDIASNRQ